MRDTKIWHRLNKSRFLRSLLHNKVIKYIFHVLFPPKGFIGIPFYYSYDAFFYKVNQFTDEYVILRWPKTVMDESKIAEIDILATLESSNLITNLCFQNPLLCKARLDISLSYDKNDKIPGLPYYPPNLSRTILDNKVKYKDSFFYLKGDTYFLSLVYHIVLHKGFQSKIPCKFLAPAELSLNKYILELNDIRRDVTNLSLPDQRYTLESLYDWLNEVKWLPSSDTLHKISLKNDWLESHLSSLLAPTPEFVPESLVLFFVREANEHQAEEIKNFISDYSLHPVYISTLSNHQRQICKSSIRGGNWPANDGGSPSHVILVNLSCSISDYISKCGLIKKSLRNKSNFRKCGGMLGFSNVVHSSDSHYLAYEYALAVFGEERANHIIKNFIK